MRASLGKKAATNPLEHESHISFFAIRSLWKFLADFSGKDESAKEIGSVPGRNKCSDIKESGSTESFDALSKNHKYYASYDSVYTLT